MLAWGRKYALDSNVFIQAFRSAERNEELRRFRGAYAPFEHLSAVVVHELQAGARTRRAKSMLQRHLLDPLERRGRLFAPTYAGWKRSGDALARLSVLERVPVKGFGRSFTQDVLLADSCREAGVVLLTSNARDFTRIRRVISFEFVAVWHGAGIGGDH